MPAVSGRIGDQSPVRQATSVCARAWRCTAVKSNIGIFYLFLHRDKSGLINTKYIKQIIILKLKFSWIQRYIFYLSIIKCLDGCRWILILLVNEQKKVLIFITPQFNRNISKVKQFYHLKIVSPYLKDLCKELVKVSSAKSFSLILYDFLK